MGADRDNLRPESQKAGRPESQRKNGERRYRIPYLFVCSAISRFCGENFESNCLLKEEKTDEWMD